MLEYKVAMTDPLERPRMQGFAQLSQGMERPSTFTNKIGTLLQSTFLHSFQLQRAVVAQEHVTFQGFPCELDLGMMTDTQVRSAAGESICPFVLALPLLAVYSLPTAPWWLQPE